MVRDLVWVKTISSQVLRDFADSRRRIVSDWRILIATRRLARAQNAPLPNEDKAVALRRQLDQQGSLTSVEGVPGVFEVDVPYANLLETSEEQIIQEANPWAVFGYLTAMVHHGLTDLAPKQIYVITFQDGEHQKRVPLGTSPEDWVDLDYSAARRPKKVRRVVVNWTELAGKFDFGVTIGYSLGMPIYITDAERTLIDALRKPEKSGGIANVFQAWRKAESMNADRLVGYVDRYGVQNLRQRVGYLLERLGQIHPRLEQWKDRLQRGGSVKLVPSKPYEATFSAEWNLSLNVAPSVLAILDGAINEKE